MLVTDIPQVACRLTARSPDEATRSSVFLPRAVSGVAQAPGAGRIREYNKVNEDGVSTATINNRFGTLSSFLKRFAEWKQGKIQKRELLTAKKRETIRHPIPQTDIPQTAGHLGNVGLDFDTASGNATEGVDYIGVAGTLVFSPGVTQQLFTVDIIGDTTTEDEEFFFLDLDNLQNAIFDLSQDYFGGNVPSKLVTTHSIIDDDNPNDFSQTINSNFLNSYTFTISGSSSSYSDYFDAITLNATEVIEYLSDFISWDGILDFVVNFDGPINYGPNGVFAHEAGNGLLPAYGGIAVNGQTFAQQEALTGVDGNGSDYDLGLYLLPNANGSLTNFGFPPHFPSNWAISSRQWPVTCYISAC